MPGSISTNAPNEVRLRTFPLIRMPTGYFCGSAIQGSSSVCFMPSETFSSVSSTFNTTASIVSPIDTIFDGWRTLRVQLISEMWTRPSIPGSSSTRSEEHTSELQSLTNLVCRLLLEKKKKKKNIQININKQTQPIRDTQYYNNTDTTTNQEQ